VKLRIEAVDISPEAVEEAQKGVYRVGRSDLVDEEILDRMTAEEMKEMFDRDGDQVRVKAWIREDIVWQVGDAGNPEVAARLGPQDIVVANRFLCHMRPTDAEECLRKIARLVAPGGHLFVSGVDLDVRTKVAAALGWKPVPDLLEEMHEGDSSLRASWPHRYWGLEPIDKRRPDWRTRYASVFQLGGSG
ncbi:MAG TPA: CheR family methyltransferase, partial [Myxococcales bacterium]|nr:CheR family methyltransferase [Myxococcales bacterium]